MYDEAQSSDQRAELDFQDEKGLGDMD